MGKQMVTTWIMATNRRGLVTFCLGIMVACSVAALVILGQNTNRTKMHAHGQTGDICGSLCSGYKSSRDQLSRQLNMMKMQYGRLNCEINKLLKREVNTHCVV